jgi:hypothetical protein
MSTGILHAERASRCPFDSDEITNADNEYLGHGTLPVPGKRSAHPLYAVQHTSQMYCDYENRV